MNTTSRALLQTVLTTDAMLTFPERMTLEQTLSGRVPNQTVSVGTDARLLVTQKDVAKALSVSRVTVWRMTKDCVLHPVEILPGTWRYPWREVAMLATGEH